MTDKPFPSTEAVDVLAGALYEVVSKQGGGLRDLDNAPVAWADVPTRLKFHQRSMALDTLAAAYPQIVADLLNHYADAIETSSLGHLDEYVQDERRFAEWLRTQATGATA